MNWISRFQVYELKFPDAHTSGNTNVVWYRGFKILLGEINFLVNFDLITFHDHVVFVFVMEIST